MTNEESDVTEDSAKTLARNVVPPLEYASPLKRFLHHDMVGSLLLLLATLAALIVVNVGYADQYHEFWEKHLGFSVGERSLNKSLHHWVNDGLMAIFFFLVGLEIKREILVGELATVRKALLPATAALGGMIFPAIIYAIITRGNGEAINGWGIPMATDIAFAAGCIAALKKWVPPSLMVFLVALAIVDDLGAVAVISIFYTETINVAPLVIGGALIILSFCLSQLGVRSMYPYAIFGIIIWVAFLESGVHATVAGVLLAFSIPADARYKTHLFEGRMKELLNRFIKAEEDWLEKAQPDHSEGESTTDLIVNARQQGLIRAMNSECHHVEAPLQRIEYNIEPMAVFLIMPIFAFANAGLHLEWSELGHAIMQPITLGVFFGLVIGKPLGIMTFSFIAVKMKWAELPNGVTWSNVLGLGFLAGIGFTMSLFINGLAFTDPETSAEHIAEGKIGTFIASIVAAIIGITILRLTCRIPQNRPPAAD